MIKNNAKHAQRTNVSVYEYTVGYEILMRRSILGVRTGVQVVTEQ
jgi:hypothetical protein